MWRRNRRPRPSFLTSPKPSGLERNEGLGRRLRRQMCNMSTEQKPYTLTTSPSLSYHYPRRLPSIPTNRHGSDHRSTQDKRKRHHPYYCQSWVLMSSPISPLFHYNHRPGNSSPVPQKCLPMVRAPQEGHNQQGPSIHLPLWKGASCQNRGPTEHLNSLPSANRWTIRTKEPMDRTIPPHSHIYGP